MDHPVHQVKPLDAAVGPGRHPCLIQPLGQGPVKGLKDQGRLSRAGYPCDADKTTHGKGRINGLKIVGRCAADDDLPAVAGASARGQIDAAAAGEDTGRSGTGCPQSVDGAGRRKPPRHRGCRRRVPCRPHGPTPGWSPRHVPRRGRYCPGRAFLSGFPAGAGCHAGEGRYSARPAHRARR